MKLHPQTGPVTAAGKEISSSNAATHGGTAEKLIVAGERREDFDALDASRRLEIYSKKEEAQAQQRGEAQWKAACNGFDHPTLVQKITVTTTSEGTLTTMTPTNQAIERQLDRKSPYPPEEVYRIFHFPQGMPPEYHSFTDREHYRRERGHTVEHWYSPAAWREVAADEQELGTGHALPG